MGLEKLEGTVFMVDPETGATSPLGWVDDSGISSEDPSGDSLASFQEITVSLKMTGRTAEKTMRILLGLPYKHPRQILHNGRKP